jgi:hypothetical protein
MAEAQKKEKLLKILVIGDYAVGAWVYEISMDCR